MIKQAAAVVSIGIVVFVAILLGDARQHIIDVFVSGIVLVAAGILWVKKEVREPPKSVYLLWGASFLVILAGLTVTDSIGATVQSLVRYAVGALLFLLGFSVYSEQRAMLAERVMLALGVVVAVVSGATLFVAQPSWLPSMNLLYPSYGHNHAADLLLLVLPCAFAGFATSRRRAVAVPVIIIAGLLLTFARAAWVVGALTLATLIGTGVARKRVFLAGVFAVFVIFGGGLWVFADLASSPDAPRLVPPVVQKFIKKSSPLKDPRWEYWRQALLAARERPVLGSGGGTFYFVSRRFQSRPGVFSWFAHSLPLQALAEHGFFGGAVIMTLFLWAAALLFRAAQHARWFASSMGRLAVGGLVTLVYGMVEFNLGFMVVWSIFWVISGFALRATSGQAHVMKKPAAIPFGVLLGLIGVYYILLTMQNAVFAFSPKRADLAFYLSPFDQTAAIAYLASPAATENGILLAEAFHRRDPEVVSAIGDAWRRQSQQPRAKAAYALALILDSRTEERHEKYVSYLLYTKDYGAVVEWLRVWPTVFFPRSALVEPVDLFIDQQYVESNSSKISTLFDGSFSHEVRYARFFYDAGLWYLSKHPTKTRALWKQASRLNPKLSDLWIERASLEKFVFQDASAADAMLVACAKNPEARSHCIAQRKEGWLPAPGSYKEGIMTR